MQTKPTNLAPSLSHAIIALGEQDNGPKTTNEAVGAAFRRSATTGHRILAGDRDAEAQEYANAVDSPIGEAVVAAIFGGSKRWVVTERHASPDIDGNGIVDKDDVLAGSIAAMRLLADKLEAIRASDEGRHYTPTQHATINSIAAKAITQLGSVIAAVNQLSMTGPRMSA